MLTLIRLSGTYHKTHRQVSFSSLSRFMNKERYKVVKCLDKLIECKIVKKTSHPCFPNALCLVVNSNYTEWTCSGLLQDASDCITAKPQTSPSAQPAAAETSKAEPRRPGKKRIVKNSKIRKFYHSPRQASFCPDEKQIKENPEIRKFYHSPRTPDAVPAFNFQNSASNIQNFHPHRPRAPAQAAA